MKMEYFLTRIYDVFCWPDSYALEGLTDIVMKGGENYSQWQTWLMSVGLSVVPFSVVIFPNVVFLLITQKDFLKLLPNIYFYMNL